MSHAVCSLDECEKPSRAKGMCVMHYTRMRRAGTLPPKPACEDRFWASVDKKPDGCWEWMGFRDAHGYGRFYFPGLGRQVHRISYALAVGTIEPGAQIDHKCHNTSCVNPDHLRPATNAENQQNLRGARCISKSGVLGVHWRKDAKKWQVTVKSDNRSRHVGYYENLEDAEAASKAARAELFSHFQA